MTVTQDDKGRLNVYAKEPTMYITEEKSMFGFTEFAEKVNGRIAMISVIAAILNYYSTGQVIPGVW